MGSLKRGTTVILHERSGRGKAKCPETLKGKVSKQILMPIIFRFLRNLTSASKCPSACNLGCSLPEDVLKALSSIPFPSSRLSSYLSNTLTNLYMALSNFSLSCFVLYCYAFVQYGNVKPTQYNTMHKFVAVLNNPLYLR